MPSSPSIARLALVVALVGLGAGVHAESRSADHEAEAVDRSRQSSVGLSSEGARRSTPDGRGAAIPLRPPAHPDRSSPLRPAVPQSGLHTLVAVVGSLGAVLGLFFVFAWAMRRGMPGTIAFLPREALEVLGRAPLAGRQQVHLVRLGSKLVLISVTPTGAETLSEVTEPDEVQRLVGLCRQEAPASATSLFRQALERFGRQEEPGDG